MTELTPNLNEAWREAQAGNGQIVWLKSQVGAGKSGFLSRFFQSLDNPTQEAAVVFCRCGDASIVSTSDHGELEALIAQIAEGVRAFGVSESDQEMQTEGQWCLPSLDFLTSSVQLSAVTRSLPDTINHRVESHLGVLFDVARLRPICLILDDVQRSDEASLTLLKTIEQRLPSAIGVQLLLIASETLPLESTQDTLQNIAFRRSASDIEDFITDRLRPFGTPTQTYLDAIANACNRNFLVAKALMKFSEHYQAFKAEENEACEDPNLETYPQYPRLCQLAQGLFPTMPAHLQADLEQASILGVDIQADVMAAVWSVPLPAATLRLDALISTGMVFQENNTLRFLSEELASQFRDQMPVPERQRLHRKVAQILRGRARSSLTAMDLYPHLIDVTDTWRESQKRDQVSKQEFDLLWTAAHHFSQGDRADQAAEAAVTLVERLFETSGGHSYLAGKAGRRADRERRHRIYAVLTEAENQISRAVYARNEVIDQTELLTIKIRLYNVKSRFKQVMGDFLEAKRYAELAVELSTGLVSNRVKIEAQQVQLEVHYASGDAHAARLGLSSLMRELSQVDDQTCIETLTWLSEIVGRWEWYGLQERLFEVILGRLTELKAEQAVNKVQLEWLAASAQSEALERSERLVERFINEERSDSSKGDFAEQLARFASELNHARVDTHYDLLSGEYYSVDLLNDDTALQLLQLTERLSLVQEWFREAERLAKDSQSPLSQLRVVAIELGTIYESRERLFELLEKWTKVPVDDRPSALQDVVHILENGAYATEQIERLTQFTIGLSRDLELYQIIGDTIYEALERETPTIVADADHYFDIAEAAYQEVDDVYGLLTLILVRLRQLFRDGHSTSALLRRAEDVLVEAEQDLTDEQCAFIRYRLGDHYLKLEGGEILGIQHLEKAVDLYDRVGDMGHVQTIADRLTAKYKEAGDLSKFRSIRERFNQFDPYNDGVDPLGLELRIEHLLQLAQNEEDEIKAIGMVEECVQLFSRVPDGTTRIDECFVEISKICRRRAERSETDAGHEDWLQRSLEAVQIAVSINRSLGNYFRVFEEYHELFEDLLGLGLYDEYLRHRAENRELAFAVGNISELTYLFEEHLQFDPDEEPSVFNLSELRGFYEGLSRYVQGMGAYEEAAQLQRTFVAFLLACGEDELADIYRSRHSFGKDADIELSFLQSPEFEKITE